MSDGSAFTGGFYAAYSAAMAREERKRQEEAMLQSLTAMSGANEVLQPATTMQPTQVQVPTAPLPGQGGNVNAPAMIENTPIQTQTETANIPQADPYKEGVNAIKKQYAETMKANLPKMTNPQVAAQFIHQETSKRDMALAQHNSAMFQNYLMQLMQDGSKTPIQKAQMGMLLNSKYKVGMKPNEVMKMFEVEREKPVVIGRGGSLVDSKGNVLYQNEMQYAPRGGGSGGSGRPVNPNTHDPNSGLPLGTKEKWARTYENTGLIRDENLLAEYENYLGIYQADPESVEGMVAKKWLDANQRRVNIASDNRNQYWSVSSGGAYQAGQSDSPPAESPQAPPTETEEQRKQRLKAALGIQ